MNYYPFHIGDYASATRHLSWDEDCAYRRLLDAYYTAEKPLPSDVKKVCRLVVATTAAQRQAVQTVLDEFFRPTEAGWVNERADAEIASAREKSEANEQRDDHERERMRRYRERRSIMFAGLRERGIVPAYDVPMKELQHLHDTHCNGTATDLQREQAVSGDEHATAIPIPIPTPIPTPIKKKGRSPFVLPDWVPAQAWKDYEEMRQRIKKPMTDRARALTLGELEKLRDAGNDPAAVLDRSVAKCWTSVYPVPEEAPPSNVRRLVL